MNVISRRPLQYPIAERAEDPPLITLLGRGEPFQTSLFTFEDLRQDGFHQLRSLGRESHIDAASIRGLTVTLHQTLALETIDAVGHGP